MTAPLSLGLHLLLGIAGGVAVGGGVIALFVVLDIIPGWRSSPPPTTRFTGMKAPWSAVRCWER